MTSDPRATSGAPHIPSVNFCFQCGKRLGAGNPTCYYCGAPRRRPRSTEEERRCPFCDLEIRAKAIKCPHCGEFVDGRPRDDSADGPRQITFIIDKAIIGGGEGMRLPAGAQLPPHILAALPAEAVRAIAQGDPSLLDDSSGVRALIAGPEDADEDDGGGSGGATAVGRARRQDTETIIEATVVSTQPHSPTPSRDAKAPACSQCAVAVEPGDGFCFHCGTGLTAQTRKHIKARKWRAGTHLYLVLTLLFAGGYGYAVHAGNLSPMVPIACLGGTIASGLAGLIGGRGQIARAVMLLLALGAGWLLWQVF